MGAGAGMGAMDVGAGSEVGSEGARAGAEVSGAGADEEACGAEEEVSVATGVGCTVVREAKMSAGGRGARV